MTYVTVDVDLCEFDDEELVEELQSRGFTVYEDDKTPYTEKELMYMVYENKRSGKDYNKLLDDLIYQSIGRVL